MFKLSVSTIFFFIFVSSSYAQISAPQQTLDSLLIVNKNHIKDDSLKTVILRQLYLQYFKLKNTEKAEEYVEKTIAIAQRNNIKLIIPRSYFSLGLYYHGITKYLKAEQNYSKALTGFEELGDLDWKASVHLNLGALYLSIPDYAKALAANQNAIQIYQMLKNNIDLASCYVNVSGIYASLRQESSALAYLKKALRIFSAANANGRGVALAYGNIGKSYFSASNEEYKKMGIHPSLKHSLALENLDKGLVVAKYLKDASVLTGLYTDLGSVYESLGNSDLALDSYKMSLNYADQLDNKSFRANSLLALSEFYLNAKNYKPAIPLLQEALQIGENYKLNEVQRLAYSNLSKVEEKLGNYSSSLAYFKQYIYFKDVIFSQEKEKEITRRQLQLDFSVKENEFRLTEHLTSGRLNTQILLAKQQQQRLTLKKNQLALSEQERALQQLNFLRKQTQLENEKAESASLLAHQKLTTKLKEREIGLQKIQLKFNKNISLILSVLATLLFIFLIHIFYARRKTVKLNKIVSKQKLALENLGAVKDKIFGVVSHDMRSPVNSLISFMQLLDNGNISKASLIKYTASLKNALGHTSIMMENLLNWAASQMDGYKVVTEKFDSQLCVNEVTSSLRYAAEQKHIRIVNTLKSGILCSADRSMTSLILRNLLNNAIKFTPNDGEVRIEAILDQNKISFTITDTGVGLSDEQINAFNDHENLSAVSSSFGTNNEKGTGLGLMLCKTFTKLMHGHLNATTEQDKGSVFKLTLPRAS